MQNPPSRHDLEIAMFEKIDARLDMLAEDMKDVRERVIRIEAQDVTGKVAALEQRVQTLERWQSRITGQVALIIVPISAAIGAIFKLILDLVTSHH